MIRYLFLSLYLTFQVAEAHENQTKNILVMGDSISAGYGLEQKDAWPSLMEKRLKSEGKKVKVINGSISGSTTASAPKRLKFFLKGSPHILILALGSNDGLRGVPVTKTEENLTKTIELARKNKIKIVLAGNQMPPNYGEDYRKQFAKVYPRLAKKYGIKLIPFLLKGVGGEEDLNQSDGIHPNEEGQKVVSENVYQVLKEIL